MRWTGLAAVALVLACQALGMGCSKEREPIRIDPQRLRELRKAAEPPPPPPRDLKAEAEQAEREERQWAAILARMPIDCYDRPCPRIEARWSPTVQPCLKAAQSFRETATCFSRATWRLERIVDRQFRRAAAAAPDAEMAERISTMRSRWRRRLSDCDIDTMIGGWEGDIRMYFCRYSFTIDRQMALERLTRK
jgi:hypothetical protein